MEVCSDRSTNKLSLPEHQPDRRAKIRTLSDSLVKNKKKILFAPSTNFSERKRRKDRREERPTVVMRNFSTRGKKVVNLGDTEVEAEEAKVEAKKAEERSLSEVQWEGRPGTMAEVERSVLQRPRISLNST